MLHYNTLWVSMLHSLMSDIRFTKSRNDNRIRHIGNVPSESVTRINERRGATEGTKHECGREPPWHIFITSKADDRNNLNSDLRKVEDSDVASTDCDTEDTEPLMKHKVKYSSGTKAFKHNYTDSKCRSAETVYHKINDSKNKKIQSKGKGLAPVQYEIKDSQNHGFQSKIKHLDINSSTGKVNSLKSGNPINVNMTQERGHKKDTEGKRHKRLDKVVKSSSTRDMESTSYQPEINVDDTYTETQKLNTLKPAASIVSINTQLNVSAAYNDEDPVKKSVSENNKSTETSKAAEVHDAIRAAVSDYMKVAAAEANRQKHEMLGQPGTEVKVKRPLTNEMHDPPNDQVKTTVHRKTKPRGEGQRECSEKVHNEQQHVPFVHHEKTRTSKRTYVEDIESCSSVQMEGKEKVDGKGSISRESRKQPIKIDQRNEKDTENRSHHHHHRRHHGHTEEITPISRASDFHLDNKQLGKEHVTPSPALQSSGSQRNKEKSDYVKRNNNYLETTASLAKEDKHSTTSHRRLKEGQYDSKYGKLSSLSAISTTDNIGIISHPSSLTCIEAPSPTCIVSSPYTLYETSPFHCNEASSLPSDAVSSLGCTETSALNFTKIPPRNHSETSPVICSKPSPIDSTETQSSISITFAEISPLSPSASVTSVNSNLSISKSNHQEHDHSPSTSVMSSLNTQTYFCSQCYDENPSKQKTFCKCENGNKGNTLTVHDYSLEVNVLTFVQDNMKKNLFKDDWIKINHDESSKTFTEVNKILEPSHDHLEEEIKDANCRVKHITHCEDLCTPKEIQNQPSLISSYHNQTTVSDRHKDKSNLKQELCNLPVVTSPEQLPPQSDNQFFIKNPVDLPAVKTTHTNQRSLNETDVKQQVLNTQQTQIEGNHQPKQLSQQSNIQFFSKNLIDQPAVETIHINNKSLNETDLKHRVLSAQQTHTEDNHRNDCKQCPASTHAKFHSVKEKKETDLNTKYRGYHGGHLPGREQLAQRRLPIKRSVSSGALSVRDNNTSFFRRMNESYFYDDTTDSDDYDDVGVDLDEMLKQMDIDRSRKSTRNLSFSSNIEKSFCKTDTTLSGNVTRNDSCKSIRETVSCDRLKIRRCALADPLRMIMSQEDRERIERDVQRRRQSMARKVSQFINIQLGLNKEEDLI